MGGPELCAQPPLCHTPEQTKPTATTGKPLGLSYRHALVAQGIEHRFPKPGVAGSIPAEGAEITP
jgi:hypothetical protein